ncbi:TOMM precursor leader peptide-binding protein [Tumebacillus sp. ITR2]|uniref:TOMM leader peptide-binding protein n=1 Tax=Tumebacillus amylolyticus TaxID=2801339 RepID=A0ABS1J9N8_9BACL|nr:TOMM precursor leader peptide-binding protein [Tumebacillus amylolyticus]MBL0386966.1 TOMM precursor leader peptide-binding protein [Tumebacillus amylolyticus]
MSRELLLLGVGTLATELHERLGESFAIARVESADDLLPLLQTNRFAAVLSAYDLRHLAVEQAAQACAQLAGVPYLRTHLNADRCFLGPWVLPDRPGCVTCAEWRMRNAHPNKEIWNSLQAAQLHPRYTEAEKGWTAPFLDLAATLVDDEMHALVEDRPLSLVERVHVAYDGSLTGRTHAFLPHPYCTNCQMLPLDSPELAEIRLQPRPKPHPRSYRSDNPLLTRDHLRKVFYDWRMGLVNHMYRDTYSKFLPITGAELPMDGLDTAVEIGYGRTTTFPNSEMTSILEALERYAGMYPRGRRTVKYGSYQDFREEAVNPESFGLHDEAQRSEPGYKYVPYDETLPFYWVYAYSWQQQKSVLIPEQNVYYRLGSRNSEKPVNRFVYETSNGCAMGGSLEEAIYYALLEVIERDSFLVAWYNRQPLVELNLDDASDPTIAMIKDRVEAAGYRLHLFDMTMETGIPTVWATMVNPREDAGVRTYSAAAAHPDPEKAVLGAIVEVVTSMSIYEITMPPKRDEAEAMLHDGSVVQTMHDHVLLYSHPETLKRFDFLFQPDRAQRGLREVYAKWYEQEPPADLGAELKDLLDCFARLNHDVLIVDESTPELERVGIKAVKVFVMGLMTMCFGHQYRRIVVDRVQNGPVRVGWRKEPIPIEEINLDPHPFP